MSDDPTRGAGTPDPNRLRADRRARTPEYCRRPPPPMHASGAQRRPHHPPRGPRLIPGASVAGGRYRLLASHGGARGLKFWQALDVKLDREVALTFVDADQSAGPDQGASADPRERRPAGDPVADPAPGPNHLTRSRAGARRGPRQFRRHRRRRVDARTVAAGDGRDRAVADRCRPRHSYPCGGGRARPPQRGRPVHRSPRSGPDQHRRRRSARVPRDARRRRSAVRRPGTGCDALRADHRALAAGDAVHHRDRHRRTAVTDRRRSATRAARQRRPRRAARGATRGALRDLRRRDARAARPTAASAPPPQSPTYWNRPPSSTNRPT